jgi:hypothetical protein
MTGLIEALGQEIDHGTQAGHATHHHLVGEDERRKPERIKRQSENNQNIVLGVEPSETIETGHKTMLGDLFVDMQSYAFFRNPQFDCLRNRLKNYAHGA